eukprot:840516-Amphidinium_carterae.1
MMNGASGKTIPVLPASGGFSGTSGVDDRTNFQKSLLEPPENPGGIKLQRVMLSRAQVGQGISLTISVEIIGGKLALIYSSLLLVSLHPCDPLTREQASYLHPRIKSVLCTLFKLPVTAFTTRLQSPHTTTWGERSSRA